MNKQAFTLAELLITLTIIGVIAAITIPTLMKKYQQHSDVMQLKQAYSRMKQATDIAISDTGLHPESWLPDNLKNSSLVDKSDYIYTNYIKPYLKTHNYDKNNRTFYDETGVKYTLAWNYSDIGGSWENLASLNINVAKGKKVRGGINSFNMVYNFSNRVYLSRCNQIKNNLPIMMQPCCGGEPEKNLQQYKNYAYRTSYPGCHPIISDISSSTENTSCCGDIIMRSGWKVPDDYPFKW